jgi:ribosome biogenesis protein MAK21
VESKNAKPTKTNTQDEPDKVTNVNSVDSTKLLIPNRTDWYNIPLGTIENVEKLDRFGRERVFERGQRIVEQENKTYLEEFTSNNSQKKFLSQILSDGTLNDKISALTLLIQEAPLHNIKALDSLMSYCDKKSRTASLQSINALKDLLLNGILPDRKLIAFEKQQLSRTLTDIQCAIYYFEDYLKKAYFKLVGILEKLTHDPIVHVKMNVLSHIFDLLKAKPEQEANLLRLGVNKLGDIDNKVASKASYQILQLQQAHPAMKKIIVDAVIDVVFKPNNEHNAQYYSVTTLNQTILTRKDEELANSLIKTYFALFEKILVETDHHNVDSKEDKTIGKVELGRKNNRKNFKKGKKGGKSVKQQDKPESEVVQEKNSKLFSALLTGLNRAFPFSSLPNETYEKHLDTLFKITHSSNFNTSIQALVLVHHIISQQQLSSDRYYRTLYESLLDPRLVTTSKQGIYLNLLFKSLKQDTDVARVSAFVKRILQICCHWLNIGSIAGMLFLLMELSKTVPQIQDLMIDFASRPDPEENQIEVEDKDEKNTNEYDSRKRDPKHANADKSSLWELNQFMHHYHPTVSIYASALLEGKQQPKPDLGLFSLAHFLDRFVYKNSKEKPVTKGSSIMQPLGGAHTGSLLVKATNVLNTDIPANTENWLLKKSEDIKPDEMFFHQYFTSKVSKLKSKTQVKDAKQDDDDEEEGNLDDDEIWQALVKSKPEVEDDGSEDDGFSDLDEADFDDMSDLSDASDNDQEAEEENDNEIDQASENEEDEDIQMTGFDKDEESIFGINEDDEVSDSELEIRMIQDEDDDDDEEEEEEQEEEEEKPSKKRSKSSSKKSKKPKVKDLPVFASVDDYSQYLNSDDDDFS